VGCKRFGPGSPRTGEDVAADRLRQRQGVARGKRSVIGGAPPVERLPHPLHPLGYAEIADAELAKSAIHALTEQVEDLLPGLMHVRISGLKAADHNAAMQHKQIEAALDRIGDAEVGIEGRCARLCHDRAVNERWYAVLAPPPEKAPKHQ